MDLKVALQHAIDGNAILFTGSGCSFGAVPLEGENFLTGKQLAKKLYSECGIDPAPDDDLYLASRRYLRAKKPDELVSLLEMLFTAKEVSPLHENFSQIPWKGIFTTNYDDVLELAYRNKGKKLKSITIDQDTNKFTARSGCIVHINGYIEDLDRDALNSKFKLTNASYLTEEFSKSNWSFMFRRLLETSRAIFFVGYSMYDLDIGRILYEDSTLKDKTLFIERGDVSPEYFADSVQHDFGTVHAVGLEGFWSEFDAVKKQYNPLERSREILDFSEIKITDNAPLMRDDDAFDFLLKGEMNVDFIWNATKGNGLETAFVLRDAHQTVMDHIHQGERLVVLASDMANGKTAFALGLGTSLISEGYRVFSLNESATKPYEDINTLTGLPGKVAVLIEGYSRRLDELKYFNLRKNQDLIIIVTIKSVFQDSAREKLAEIFGKQGIEISLDKLSDGEISKVSKLLTTYKLWASKDAQPAWQKERYIKEYCGRELSATLLGVVKSPNVIKRFEALFEAFGKNDELSKIVITASVLKVLGYAGAKSMVAELVDGRYLYSLDFKRNPAALEILNLSNDRLVPRSSLLAFYGLSTYTNTGFLIEQLISIAKKSHDLGSSDSIYLDIYVSLVNYKLLQSMIPEKGKRDALIRFYESTKNLRAAANHPHFWLQYALARLAYDEPDDLVKAKLYLDAAYAHAKTRPGYHVRHMDNVQARYLLKAGRVEDEIKNAFDNFVQAHQILIRQARSEKTEAPYKAASEYLNFYEAKKRELSPSQLMNIASSADEIIKNFEHLPDNVKEEFSVRSSVANLRSLMSAINVAI